MLSPAQPSLAAKLLTETLITLSAAARIFPAFREGKPVVPPTIVRWIKDGVKLSDGTVVRLEAQKIGKAWMTSRESVARFIDAQNRVGTADATATPPTAPQIEAALAAEARAVASIL